MSAEITLDDMRRLIKQVCPSGRGLFLMLDDDGLPEEKEESDAQSDVTTER